MFMRVPKESLDDFTGIDAKPKPAEPPPVKFLRSSGRFEVLKPLARSKDLAERTSGSRFARPARSPAARRLSWYQRSVAFSVCLAVIALIVGIVAGIYDVPGPAGGLRSELVMDQQPEETQASLNELDDSASSPAAAASRAYDKPYAVRSTARRKNVRRASYRPRRSARPPHLVMSSFVPTTLIIYVENGEIKTRIEPQLTGGRKKS